MKRIACFVLSLFVGMSAFAQTPPNTLTPQEKEEGFQLLFDGKELSPDIWKGDVAGYPVDDGVITCRGKSISTKKEYGDFIFRCEAKLPPGGNNGISIRGMEIQILDHHHSKYAKINDGRGLMDYQYNGSLYGVAPAERNAEKNDYLLPVGEWNLYEVQVIGTKIKVIVNAGTVLDVDCKDYPPDKPTLSGKRPKGLDLLSGSVGFRSHNDPVQFRGIRIKPLQRH